MENWMDGRKNRWTVTLSDGDTTGVAFTAMGEKVRPIFPIFPPDSLSNLSAHYHSLPPHILGYQSVIVKQPRLEQCSKFVVNKKSLLSFNRCI
jgi:hypothetical protein